MKTSKEVQRSSERSSGAFRWADVEVEAFADVAPRLVGDIDGDGVVGFEDLLALLAAWGDCPEPPDPCAADLDDDGDVDFDDLLLLLAGWTA